MRGAARSALALLLHAVVCVLLVAARNGSAFVIPGPSDAVRGLVVVGSQRDPRACIGVWTGGAFVVAPAHCIVQMRGAPAEFVDFGFQPTSAPRDPADGGAELVGAFKHDKRVAVARIAYHPRFMNASAQLSHNATVGVDPALTEFDWALIKLQEPRVSNSSKNFWLSGVMASEARDRLPQSIGMLRIDRTSLDVRFVNDTLLLDNARCALYPSAASAEHFLCAVPRRPEARCDADRRNRAADWNLLITRPSSNGDTNALLGFETSNADAASFTSFTVVGGTVKYFLIDESDGNVVFDDLEIVGGVNVQITPELAFIAGVRVTRAGRNVCGGSLVTPTLVLTAAHCLDDIGASLWVSIGSKFSEGDATGEQIRVARAIRHPGFDKDAMRNDLALLELKYPSIQTPVALASGSASRARAAVVLGFGAASAQESAALSTVLQSAAVDVIASSQQCSLEMQFEVDDSMLCAVGKSGADACAGDSGGPLIVRASSSGGAPTLVGVVSYGRGCGSGLPGVYADVARGLAFITSDLSNIVGTQRTSKLFDGKAIVFVSTTALDGLEAIMTRYGSKTLSQRSRRFQTEDTATSSSLKAQHWVC